MNLVESFLVNELRKNIPNFEMREFIGEVKWAILFILFIHPTRVYSSHVNSYEGEIFEMLGTITDFLTFKELMLDYKKVRLNC